jgi:hypothetical protein
MKEWSNFVILVLRSGCTSTGLYHAQMPKILVYMYMCDRAFDSNFMQHLRQTLK